MSLPLRKRTVHFYEIYVRAYTRAGIQNPSCAQLPALLTCFAGLATIVFKNSVTDIGNKGKFQQQHGVSVSAYTATAQKVRSPPMQTDAQPHITPHWDLLWRVRLSGLYHLKRERFLDGVDKASKALSALGGAAAFTQIKTNPDLGLWVTGAIALVSTLSLVYGPSTKARKHADLARDFKLLESDIVAAGTSLSEAQLFSFEARYLKVESAEPAALGALVTQCHNELTIAIGQKAHVTPLPLVQRLFKNWFDFDQSVAA